MVQIQLQITHCISAIGQECDLLIRLHALGFQNLKHAPFGFFIIVVDECKPFGGPIVSYTFAGNDLKPAVFA